MDLFALALSLAAIRLAARPVSDRRTYGWHRAEILASLINGLSLLLIAVGILHEAWGRFQHPEPVKSREMFVIAVIGLVMNLIAARLLHGHAHHDLNVRSAFLHVLGDALASVGVIVGGLIMLQTGWYVVDSLISAGIALIIGWGALRILREAGHILLEGVPPHIDLNRVVARIKDQEGVRDVHQLHVWSICSHITALSAHIDLYPDYLPRQGEVIGRIEGMLDHDFHITRTTLQGQCHSCANGDTLQPLRHRPRVPDHEHEHDHENGHAQYP
jgi:cobalt-zinc-cadmium efflux system protein